MSTASAGEVRALLTPLIGGWHPLPPGRVRVDHVYATSAVISIEQPADRLAPVALELVVTPNERHLAVWVPEGAQDPSASVYRLTILGEEPS